MPKPAPSPGSRDNIPSLSAPASTAAPRPGPPTLPPSPPSLVVDPQLWHACAGPQARLPRPGSHVIYFPQGYAEHTSLPKSALSRFTRCIKPTIVCRVLSIQHLADAETDEVYARIRLQPEDPIPTEKPCIPIPSSTPAPSSNTSSNRTHYPNQMPKPNQDPCRIHSSSQNPIPNLYTNQNPEPNQSHSTNQNPYPDQTPRPTQIPNLGMAQEYANVNMGMTTTMVAGSFAKTLTQSDANNGGGFSVPRYCAETIFPRLDYRDEPPVQIVVARDVHGSLWKFRHIYRGTPRRHLLTTGWSSFINQKKLVAGDAIIFLRSSGAGDLCIGVRRLSWSSPARGGMTPSADWLVPQSDKPHQFRAWPTTAATTAATTRDAGKVVCARLASPDSFLDAVSLASSGKEFEVVYYPNMSSGDAFCVDVDNVRASLCPSWSPGMRFKMAIETEDASRMSWFMGTVAKVHDSDPLVWPNSPWKMLQVTWDEPDLLQGITRVSPWQVELVPAIQLPPFSFPKKKVRLSRPSDLLDGTASADMPWHMMNSLYGHVDTVVPPASMQGARHEPRNSGVSLQSPKIHPTTGLFFNTFYRPPSVAPSTAGHEVGPGDMLKQQIASWAPRYAHATAMTRLDSTLSGNPDLAMAFVLKHKSRSGAGFTIDHPKPQSVYAESQTGIGRHGAVEGLGDGCRNSSSDVGKPKGGTRSPSGKKPTSFLLFGTTIDTSFSAPPIECAQAENSCDSMKNSSVVSDGNKSEVYDNAHNFFPLPSKGDEPNSPDSNTRDCCQLFSGSDDVGRTIDLWGLESYEELYEGLEKMFGIKKHEVFNRVLYVDSKGFSRLIGDEPYWDFKRNVKRLKIHQSIAQGQ